MTHIFSIATLLIAASAAGFAILQPPELPLAEPAPGDPQPVFVSTQPPVPVNSITLSSGDGAAADPLTGSPVVDTPPPTPTADAGPSMSLVPNVPTGAPSLLNPFGGDPQSKSERPLPDMAPPARKPPGRKPPAEIPTDTALLRILRLKHAAAPDVMNVVLEMFRDNVEALAVDAHTNTIIVRATDEQFNAVRELVAELDQAPNTANFLKETQTADPESLKRTRLRAVEKDHFLNDLLVQFGSIDVADTGSPDAGSPNEKLLTDIRAAIDDAFTQRQQEQLAEIEELTGRLQKLAKAVREREAQRDAIITKRLAELVASRTATAEPVAPPRNDVPFRQEPRSDINVTTEGTANPFGGNVVNPATSATPPITTVEITISYADSLRQRIQQHASTARRLRDEYTQGQRRNPSIISEIEDIKAMLQQDAEDASLRQELIRIQDEASAAQFEAADKKYNKIATLAEKGAYPQTELDQAKVEALRSKSELQQIKVLRSLFESIERSAVDARVLLDGLESVDQTPPASGTATP